MADSPNAGTSSSNITTGASKTSLDQSIQLSATTKDTNLTHTVSHSNTSTLLSSMTELESGLTVTDITSNLSSTTLTESELEKSRQVTRELLLKKQLLHDIQKLKIEISQKSLLIDTLKADHLNQIDDLEEKINDLAHEKQLLQAKYETQIRMLKAESDKHVTRLKMELEESLKKQRYYQDIYMRVTSEAKDFREKFVDPNIGEDEYLKLQEKEEGNLLSHEYAAMKFYEKVRPLRIQIESLGQRIDLLASDLRDKEEELVQEKLDHDNERRLRSELDVRCQKFQMQVEDLRSQLSQRSYKTLNYDQIQSERDNLDRRIVELEKACTVYKTELEARSNQMEAVRSQMQEQNQTVALLKQDKEYLNNRLYELTPRYTLLEEKYDSTCKQLDEVKLAREELYEKYLNSRDHYKREYEERMKRELDELSSRTNIELNKIKESSKEMYERENRNLRDSVNAAIMEQERLSKSEKDIQIKYNELLGEFRQLQISSDNKAAEHQNQAKLKSFEFDRIQLLHEESLRNIKEMGMQNDTLAKKLETLNQEYYVLKGESEKRILELDGRNQEIETKLRIYEKLEQELDDVVMQAAELTDERDSERVLFAYGYGANVPSTAKRRMQQSVQLARRVLQLERANTSLKKEIEREATKSIQLAGELKQITTLLDEAQQPYSYLIASMKSRDEQNKSLKDIIATMEKDNEKLLSENKELKKNNNQMTMDLERLLGQREELSVLKQTITKLKSSELLDEDTRRNMKSAQHSKIDLSRNSFARSEDLQVSQKTPILFRLSLTVTVTMSSTRK